MRNWPVPCTYHLSNWPVPSTYDLSNYEFHLHVNWATDQLPVLITWVTVQIPLQIIWETDQFPLHINWGTDQFPVQNIWASDQIPLKIIWETDQFPLHTHWANDKFLLHIHWSIDQFPLHINRVNVHHACLAGIWEVTMEVYLPTTQTTCLSQVNVTVDYIRWTLRPGYWIYSRKPTLLRHRVIILLVAYLATDINLLFCFRWPLNLQKESPTFLILRLV